MGRHTDAVSELEVAVARVPGNSRFEAYLAYAYAACSRRADAERILAELEARSRGEYVSSFGLALVHDALGDAAAAKAALERAYEEHAVEFAQARQYPPFQTLAGDARYQAIMKAVARPE